MLDTLTMGGMEAAPWSEKVTCLHRVCRRPEAALVIFFGQRRRPHAGGHLQPDADGENLGCAGRFSAKGGLYISVLTHPPPAV